ncbi:YveK family protein [Anaerorhabdus sp.]|jgi:capsular polysaccharide biosynthesis protein|uniref:YveK family protein n=1 Tax=Anaerorhabdus sp. TaxID=1872524 RepID=UPI002FC7557E
MEDNYTEIDLMKIWESFKKIWYICIIICLISTISSFLITKFLMTPKYEATGKIIVVQKNETQNTQLNLNDVNLSQKLVSTYSEILKSERISDLVLNELDLPYTAKEYQEMVNVTAASNTEVINVTVTSESAKESTEVANTIIKTFQEEIYDIMSVENVSVLNWAKVPTAPSSPSTIKNVLIGGVIGVLISGILVIILMFKDNKVKTEDEFKEVLGYPILGVIPDFEGDMARLEKENDKQ